jgi:hypothetical protein
VDAYAGYEAVNQAFEAWDNIYFSQSEKDAIAAAHGSQTLATVLDVYNTLMDTGAGPGGLDESFRRFDDVITAQYRWLSNKARRKLSHALMMNWK